MMEFFPRYGLSSRQGQEIALKKLAENIHKKYFLCCLPTGVGKSYFGQAVAEAIGKAYLLTSTKMLQDQYKNNVGDCFVLKGRNNYTCRKFSDHNCEDSQCNDYEVIKKNCVETIGCPYVEATRTALASKVIVTNYSYFLLSRQYGMFSQDGAKRDMLIMDEAHNLDAHLISFAAIDITRASLDKIGITGIPAFSSLTIDKTIDHIMAELKDKWDETNRQLNNILRSFGIPFNIEDEYIIRDGEQVHIKEIIAKLPEAAKEGMNKLKKQISGVDRLLKKFNFYKNMNLTEKTWYIDVKDANTFKISPIRSNGLFNRFLANAADKFLFMTATPGNPEAFAYQLGIDPKELVVLEAPSDFDPTRSPIICKSVASTSFKNLDNNLPILTKFVCEAAENFKGEKGIIHTASYKIAEYIVRNATPEFKARLIHRDSIYGKNRLKPVSNEEMIREHMEAKGPAILISPSMTEGVSLDDDLARWQVIVKLPFLNLGDGIIKKRAELFPEWYTSDMWIKVMQSAGRTTRSVEDYSVTYIIDSLFGWRYSLDKHYLPEWFTSRIVYE